MIRSGFTDPYALHRVALSPLLPGSGEQQLSNAVERIPSLGEQRFLEFIHAQGLAGFWHHRLVNGKIADKPGGAFLEALHRARLVGTGGYLAQHHGLRRLRQILDDAGIAHVIFKGTHIREQVYPDPALRPACDIDVLISGSCKKAGVLALARSGYSLHPVAKDIDHEVSFRGPGGLGIDLHWDILRPGRTREPLTDALLATRKDFGSHWGLEKEATLFIMLTHPVFTKYATAPQSAIMRVLDLAWWLESADPDWDRTLYWLDRAGLRSAAWIMLEWSRQLTGYPLASEPEKKLRPGRLKTRYLKYWITHDLPGRLTHHRAIVQAGLTLPAHDQLSGAMRAVGQLVQHKRRAEHRLGELVSGLAESREM